jgi:hypothetical protein
LIEPTRRIRHPLAYSGDAYLIGEVKRVARFLMGESVLEAERLACPIPELEEAEKHDWAAVRMVDPDSPVPAYIVFRSGTKYVTDEIPANFDGPIYNSVTPASRGVVLRRLKYMAKALRRCSRPAYELLEIGAIVEAAEAWSDPNTVQNSPEATVLAAISERAGHGKSPNVIEDAFELLNAVIRKFNTFRVPGIAAEKAMAVLTFLSMHPKSDGLRRCIDEMTLGVSRVKIHGQDSPPIVVPPMHLDLYLCHPALTSRGTFLFALGAARLLRKKGRQEVQSALSADGIEDFHARLYSGLGAYRGAREIYRTLKGLGEKIPSLWTNFRLDRGETHRLWVECEEARVSILSVLHQGAMPRDAKWNVARPVRMLGQAIDAANNLGVDEARIIVLDVSVRMVCPKFVRDLMLAILAVHSDRDLEIWAEKTRKVVTRLDAAFRANVLSGDPAYLHFAYEIAGMLALKLGRPEEAQTFSDLDLQIGHRVREVLAPQNG